MFLKQLIVRSELNIKELNVKNVQAFLARLAISGHLGLIRKLLSLPQKQCGPR